MGLRNLTKRFTTSTAELHEERLQQRYSNADCVSIGSAPLRTPIVVIGEVQRLRLVPRAGSPTLEITVSDGTGTAAATFMGRRSIGGMEHGRGIRLEGVARRSRGQVVFVNPIYTLLPK